MVEIPMQQARKMRGLDIIQAYYDPNASDGYEDREIAAKDAIADIVGAIADDEEAVDELLEGARTYVLAELGPEGEDAQSTIHLAAGELHVKPKQRFWFTVHYCVREVETGNILHTGTGPVYAADQDEAYDFFGPWLEGWKPTTTYKDKTVRFELLSAVKRQRAPRHLVIR